MQQLMIFQRPEEWQGQGFPALRAQISPLSLSRGNLPFSPLLAALSTVTLEARARTESKGKKEDSWYMQHIFPWLAKGPAQPPGSHQPYSNPRGTAPTAAWKSHGSPGAQTAARPPGQLQAGFEGTLSTQ